MRRRTTHGRAAPRALSLLALSLLALPPLAGCGPSHVPVRLLESGPRLPELAAAGWLNGGQPSAAELAGSIVVIDCFASW